MDSPELIRNVTLCGHLHHGKVTSPSMLLAFELPRLAFPKFAVWPPGMHWHVLFPVDLFCGLPDWTNPPGDPQARWPGCECPGRASANEWSANEPRFLKLQHSVLFSSALLIGLIEMNVWALSFWWTVRISVSPFFQLRYTDILFTEQEVSLVQIRMSDLIVHRLCLLCDFTVLFSSAGGGNQEHPCYHGVAGLQG